VTPYLEEEVVREARDREWDLDFVRGISFIFDLENVFFHTYIWCYTMIKEENKKQLHGVSKFSQ
jgi:hypothetical protein